jgi:hypothetical protein
MTIRPMERDDLDAVATLYERVVRSGTTPSAELRAWFERMLFDHPWVDPEIPSLVAAGDDGGVDGFLASHVRRLRIDGREGRLACSGQLVSDPDARRRATGAMLMKTYLDGPQDLTTTDGATEIVRVMWERLGGELAYPQSVEWWQPLRPGSLAASLWARTRGRSRPPWPVGALGRIADAAVPTRRLTDVASVGKIPATSIAGPLRAEPLTADAVVAELPQLAGRLRLYPDYDAAFTGWLLNQLASTRGRGQLRARLVRDADGGALGWFVYFLVRDGASPVIGVAAADELTSGAVLDSLLDDARDAGAAGVHGRLEPRLAAPVAARGCLLRYAGQALVHAHDPAITALAISRHALLTRLEGEWWMGPHLL